jgi:L-ascorbate metabolism protein UlaG (beta-lactamase superfamily)
MEARRRLRVRHSLGSMKTNKFTSLSLLTLAAFMMGTVSIRAADAVLELTGLQLLTNQEAILTVSVPTNANYRIDAASALPNWAPLVTLPPPTAAALQHTDSGAALAGARFYRVEQLSGIDAFTGDHLATTNGDLVIHPLFHASLVLKWGDMAIYNDPDDDAAYLSTYQGLPKADLILVSHTHGDHFSTAQIEAVRDAETVIVAPAAVYSSLTAAQRAQAVPLANGASTNLLGLTVSAVPAYNANHPLGAGNGYVLTIGGRRLYLSGDTGNTVEMRALPDIDVAFLCMNQPFTMTVNDATNAVRAFRPKVVYPYHYRDQNGSTANAATFKQLLGTDAGVEVRLRKWY